MIIKLGIPQKKTAVLVGILLLICSNSIAQTAIHLRDAIDSALAHNAALQVSETEVEYTKSLQRSSFDVQKANVDFEYGKFNSLANDNSIAISQSLDFPSVYVRAAAVNKSNIKISETSLQQHQLDVKTRVKSTFYRILVLQQKYALLLQADSIYAGFLERSEQRFKSGDVDAVEMATASNQRLQISNQLSILRTDTELEMNQFNLLLNSKSKIVPQAFNVTYRLEFPVDAEVIDYNPRIMLNEQQITLSQQQNKLEKSRMLPSVNLGYKNTSIIGFQPTALGNDVYFDRDKRFSAFSVGLGIPLFYSAQRAKIRASDVLIKQRQQQLLATKQELGTQLENMRKIYAQSSSLIQTYETSILPNASKIISTTTEKLNAGEIAYLDWVILINQSIQIRSEYFNTVQQLNEAAFEIERICAVN